MRLARMFCATLALLSAAVVADDFEQWRDAVARGDYSAAVPALQAAAAKDDARALGLLASLYQHGEAFPHDSAKALELYTRAAELGDADAQFNLGSMYLLGDGVQADEAWALTYYRQAAAQGHTGATRNLAELYRASGLAPAPLNSNPPKRPLPEEAARLHAEPAVAPVPAVKTESLAPGMSASANPPVAGAVARDITSRRAMPVPKPVVPTKPPVTASHPAPAPIPGAVPTTAANVEAATDTPGTPSLDELRAIELARAAGIAIEMDGSAAPPPATVVNMPRPVSVTPREEGRPVFTPSSSESDPDTVENSEEGAVAFASAQRYLLGQGVAADAAVGVQWLERAARAGHTQAKYELALHYLNGEGVQADEAMAITLLRDAAQSGHRQAEAKLKAVYAAAGLPLPTLTRSPPSPAPVQKAAPLPAPPSASAPAPTTVTAPTPAAERDSDFERGERHATRGAMAGMMADAAAEEDQDAAQSEVEANEQPSAAPSEQGSVVAVPGTPTNKLDASATLADARAALDAQDFPRAAGIFTRLAERGDAEAQSHIGYMTYRGEGVSADKAKAVEWYRKAAAQGNRDAQYNLAVAYAFGEGIAQNDAEALQWYRRAADQGSAVAQYSLGVSYALGEGAPRDDALAVRWYRAAAEQGYADAQFNLGQMIRAGRGVENNLTEAARWYKLAAAQGHADAAAELRALNGAATPR